MDISEVVTSELVWPYVKQMLLISNFMKELIHGGRHMQNVRQEVKMIISSCNLSRDLCECLRVAADVHDLGRLGDYPYSGMTLKQINAACDSARIDPKNEGYIDHAHLSASLFEHMPIEDLSTDQKEVITFAVKHHSVGLVGLNIPVAQTLCEQTLGLLVVADHCGDAACPDGIARAIKALKGKPILSKTFEASYLESLLFSNDTVIHVSEAGLYKSESIAAHLVYNFQATWAILKAVKHLLSDEYMDETIIPRLEMYRTIVKAFLDLQK